MSDSDTHREVRRRRTGTGDARAIVVRRRYDAPVEDVWHACTDPDRLNRWFLPVTGDLRPGGTFALEGNAHGDILRCEQPRLLTITWVFGDMTPGEVELRLSPDERGGTVLELEHASASETVEVDGRHIDVALNDPVTGLWGQGTGWEVALRYLGRYLRGELPDAPAVEWYDPENADDAAFAEQCGEAWAAVVRGGR